MSTKKIIADTFKEYINLKTVREDISLSAIDLLENSENLCWTDIYWILKYLIEFSNATGLHDKLIIKSLEDVLRNGLTHKVNSEAFLDATKIMAKLYFKYGRYKQAENCLLMLRDLSQEHIPTWVYAYSATTFYRLNLEGVLSNPVDFIELLDKIPDNDETLRVQKIGIIKDFFNNIVSFVISKGINSNNFYKTIIQFYQWLRPYQTEVFYEWEQLINIISDHRYCKNDSPTWYNSQISILKVLVEAQNQKIINLEDNIEKIYAKIEELSILGINKASEEIDNTSKNQETKIGIEKDTLSPRDYFVTSRKPKILVFGDSQLSIDHMLGIAKSMGLEKDQFDFRLDYESNKRFDFDIIRYNSPYGGILIGPNAHKIVGLGEYNSIIQKLHSEPGFPHTEEIRTANGELKITKSSFRDSLSRLVSYMQSIGLCA